MFITPIMIVHIRTRKTPVNVQMNNRLGVVGKFILLMLTVSGE